MAYIYGSVTNCKVRNGQTRTEYECRLGYQVNSQSIESNTSNVTLRLECRSISSSYTTKGSTGLTSVIDGTTVKSNAAVDMSKTNTWQNFGERTITITHNADGTYSADKSGSFTCTAGSSNYSLSSGSASVTVAPATIPRASQPTLSVGSIDIGSAVTIHMNRVSTSFTHYVYAQWASKRVEIGSNITDNVSWTLPMDFCNDIPSSPSGWGTIYVDTYSNGTYVGTKSVGFTGTVPASVVPNIGDILLSEANSNVSPLGVLVQGKSSLNVNIATSGSYGSWITNCRVDGIDNTSYWSTQFTSAVLQQAGERTVTVKVTDSRGRTATKTAKYTCIAYNNPSISVATVTRCNADGTDNEEGEYVKYSFKADVAPINNKNTYSYKLGYKTGNSGYTYITINNSAYSLDVSNVIISGVTFSVDNSYDFEFLVNDYFTNISGNPTKIERNIGTGFTLMDFRYTGKGMAIGKVSEKDAFEVGMDTEILGDLKARNVNSYYAGVINPAHWYHIGNFTFNGQGNYAVIDCYMGEGQNGRADQNTHARILIKQGWTEEALPIGITTNFTQNYRAGYKIKIYHISKTECALYIYLPYSYNDLTYIANGSYKTFIPSNTVLDEEPITDKESTYYDLTSPSYLNVTTPNTTDTWIPVLNAGKVEYTLRKFYKGEAHTNYATNRDYLVTLDFLSYWNGAYNSSGTSSLKRCSGGEIQAKPVVAYSNTSGTTGTVTLSVSAANYTNIRISYKNVDGQIGATTVSGTSNAQCTTYGTIIRKNGDNTAVLVNSALFTVSGNTITISKNSQANMWFGDNDNATDTNALYITKVELWN